jgi:hypothetical protein
MYRRILLTFWLVVAASSPALAQQSTPDNVVAEMYKLCDQVSIVADL